MATTVLPTASVAPSQSGASAGVPAVAVPKTIAVLVIQTAKPGVRPEQIMAVMPSEIRATVKLYFDGKIRQWYSRGDGRGVVFLVDAKTEDEARAIIETLPLQGNPGGDWSWVLARSRPPVAISPAPPTCLSRRVPSSRARSWRGASSPFRAAHWVPW